MFAWIEHPAKAGRLGVFRRGGFEVALILLLTVFFFEVCSTE